MLTHLTHFFPKDYQHYAEGLGLQQAGGHAFSWLLQEQQLLTTAIKLHTAALGVSKPRAQASVWHMYYCLRILPAIIVSQSLLNQQLPLRLDQTQLDLQHWRLLLPHQGTIQFSNTAQRYEELIFQHFAPLHTFLHQQFGIAEKVLWSNCQFRLDSFCRSILHLTGHHPQLAQDQLDLDAAHLFQPRANPLHACPHIRQDAAGSYRIRTECCLLHEVRGKSFCDDCPKLPQHMQSR
jgi:siderophore-iron reductase FhuF